MIVPQIRSTIVVVVTTILILVLKIFDIVYVMTDGNFGTDVLAEPVHPADVQLPPVRPGRGVVVFLIVVTIPFMVINIRRFREQEATR